MTLRSIGDAVISTDVEAKVTFLNLVAEELTGWSWQDAAGRPLGDIVHFMDAASRTVIPDPMAQAIEEDATAHLPIDTLLVRSDGVEIAIDDTISPIHDGVGRAAGAVVIFRDVTTARSMSLRMQAVDAELERSNRELQDFATIASHDLQEPLRKIQAFGDRLEEQSAGALDAESEDYLRRMRGAAAPDAVADRRAPRVLADHHQPRRAGAGRPRAGRGRSPLRSRGADPHHRRPGDGRTASDGPGQPRSRCASSSRTWSRTR